MGPAALRFGASTREICSMPKSLTESARRFLLATSTIVLLGCQGVVPPAVPPGDGARAPKILRFEAADRSIDVQSKTTLEWATEDADRVKITRIGAVAPTGSTQVGPGDYTLTARNSKTGKEVTAVVKVQGFIPGPPPRPPRKKPVTDPRL